MSTVKLYTKIFKSYPDAITVKELQQMLGIGKNSAYMLINNKKISHTKVGKKIIIPKSSVIDYLVQNHS